jgi:hypothetical protein
VATCRHPRLLRPLEREYCCLGYLTCADLTCPFSRFSLIGFPTTTLVAPKLSADQVFPCIASYVSTCIPEMSTMSASSSFGGSVWHSAFLVSGRFFALATSLCFSATASSLSIFCSAMAWLYVPSGCVPT